MPLPISALQHLVFCERQCALIHVEQVWAENQFTAEGQILHEKAHDGPDEVLAGVRIRRGLHIRSEKLGLSGIADVVEFHPDGSVQPVEYKRGKPKKNASDTVQLCAQAICLEESLDISIETGALFYGQRRRRHECVFDESLRNLTAQAARRLHELIAHGETPPAVRQKKCESCSLLEICMPGSMRLQSGVARWFDRKLQDNVSQIT